MSPRRPVEPDVRDELIRHQARLDVLESQKRADKKDAEGKGRLTPIMTFLGVVVVAAIGYFSGVASAKAGLEISCGEEYTKIAELMDRHPLVELPSAQENTFAAQCKIDEFVANYRKNMQGTVKVAP